MKKLLALMLALMMLLSLTSCAGKDDKKTNEEVEKAEEKEAEKEEKGSSVTETDHIKIEGICVDDSYISDESDSLKMVYLFYTLTAKDSNLSESSVGMYITVNDSNEYLSENYPDDAAATKYTKSYYYSSYVEDIFVGDSLKMIATFEIPKGDLTEGKALTFENSGIPGIEDLKMTTDDIKYFSTPEEIAEEMDPEGYAEEMFAREDADEATAAQVKELIYTGPDYAWTFYVNSSSYEMHFLDNDAFELVVNIGGSGHTANGVYSVKNGYIFCTYPDTGYTVEVPYTVVNGELEEFELADAFDVNM